MKACLLIEVGCLLNINHSCSEFYLRVISLKVLNEPDILYDKSLQNISTITQVLINCSFTQDALWYTNVDKWARNAGLFFTLTPEPLTLDYSFIKAITKV